MRQLLKKRQKLIITLVIIVISYLLLRSRTYNYETSVVIPKVHPSDVWEFVSDFSNMKYLNPTIVDFNILKETGNYNRWQYSTEYKEHLSHWPYLENTAIAHFDVYVASQNSYVILSNHTTCLFGGLLCLRSHSQFKFVPEGIVHGSRCTETIEYTCPFLMAQFCEREVKYQRNKIFYNLKMYFNKA